MPIILLVIATAMTALVGDAVAESVIGGGGSIVAFGGVVEIATDHAQTLTILTILSATVALAWAAAIAFARGRRVGRRLGGAAGRRDPERARMFPHPGRRHDLPAARPPLAPRPGGP